MVRLNTSAIRNIGAGPATLQLVVAKSNIPAVASDCLILCTVSIFFVGLLFPFFAVVAIAAATVVATSAAPAI